MSVDQISAQSTARRGFSRSRALVLYAFASTLFVSAMLLFSVQPMFAKMVVPRLGGAPSVWAVAMCFFQAVLLLGYCYAHLLTRLVPASWATIIHLVVCMVAFFFLPLSLPDGWEQAPGSYTQLWLIGLFAVSVGWPFFAVSANAPLLQAWFGRTGHPHAADPYFLYGASNIGSMVALLGYPVIIEPAIGLSSQGFVWAAGFALLSLLIGFCGWLMFVNARTRDLEISDAGPAAAAPSPARPAWRDRFIWIALAFVPSGLLVAFTTHITTDVASAPFLWIIPLALYLLTYILVFRDPPKPSMSMLLKMQPVFVAATLLSYAGSGMTGWLIGVIGGTGAFFTTAMICHRTMYERRPGVAHLTEFYLWMSFGGVLGGVFTALLAPVLFPLVIEYPLLILLGLICRKDVIETSLIRSIRANPLLVSAAAVTGFAAALLLPRLIDGAGDDPLFAATAAITIACAAAAIKAGDRLFAIVSMVLTAVVLLPRTHSSEHVERSFFGVHRVLNSTDGSYRLLQHGTTVHGGQRLIGKDGQPMAGKRPVPSTYYYPQGPMNRMVSLARELKPAGQTLTAGVIGLGSGALACASRPGENWRFYEIDPVVVKIARDPAHFTYLSSCQPNAPTIIGDARLTVAKEPAGLFNYLLVDAFSSDTIPVHLLTREAVAMYLTRVSADGLLVMHISNKFLDLAPVLEAAVAGMDGVHGVTITDFRDDPTYDSSSSRVVVIARSAKALEGISGFSSVEPFGEAKVAAWTDDFSNILGALVRNLLN
jgi:hypothetical protein